MHCSEAREINNQIQRDRKQTSGCPGLVGGGCGQMDSDCSVGTGFPFAVMETFGTRWGWWSHSTGNVLSAADLDTC